MTAIFDPRIFNAIIMALYVAAALRWALAGYWIDMTYWLAALVLTMCVTWGYSR